MPLYEYICKECGQRFEKLVRMSDDPRAVRCPGCAGPVERALSTFATSGGSTGQRDSGPANCGPVG